MRSALTMSLLLLLTSFALAAEPVLPEERPFTRAEKDHWAFRPPIQPAIPAVHRRNWVRTPIDAFILAKLEAAGLSPSPEADQRTLLRRVTFDLTGLPPTLAEQEAFLADTRPDAYERLVGRLLASPHYGERWAQHWLDVVRYAESNGYEADSERPHAWHYRDYVIRSFNEDKPYNQFVTEQIAGDFLAKDREPRAVADDWIATGLHRCGPVHMTSGNTDPELNRQEVLTEMVNGLSSAVLGLTMACTRCHDHKFDPLTQADYYRLQAFFASTKYRDVDLATAAEMERQKKQTDAIKAKVAPLQQKVLALEQPYRKKINDAKVAALDAKYVNAVLVPAAKRTAEQKKLAEQAEILLKITWDEVLAALSADDRWQRQEWRDEIHALEAHLPPPAAQAWAVADDDKPAATYILKRGDVKNKGPAVEPGFPRIMRNESSQNSSARLTRLDLAEWITRPDHPLTARVWVNRIWQHHFGHGIVGTPNDFGLRGEQPTHPELLDWLATEFIRSGWSTKAIHRAIVLSSTYRQSSQNSEFGMRNSESKNDSPHPAFRIPNSIDPDNHLLWHMNRHRLEGETLRDAMLAVTGNWNRQMGGPMVRVPLEKEVYDLIFTEGEPDGLWKPSPEPHAFERRSIYLFAKRNVRLPMLEAFDQPDTLNSCAMRPTSTFAPQALILMNGPFAQAQSQGFAVRLLREVGSESDALVARAFLRAFGRPARDFEMKWGISFLERQTKAIHTQGRTGPAVACPPGTPPKLDPAYVHGLCDFCLALFNANEFLYVR
ncbi:MAG TPA: DUF1549 and DUF1553 domain-containing protein [Gemmataceae bacterium]|nr:DUF1549 and DUF1553 domain-containing protein [Gemmataceae bacterium]